MRLRDMPEDVELRKRERLRVLCQKLKIPVVEARLRLVVTDKNGREVSYLERFSHSYTRNFYNRLTGCTFLRESPPASGFGDGVLTVKQTSGALAGANTLARERLEDRNYGYRQYASQTVSSILLGTDNTAESFEDYKIGILIPDGSGAGQMEYQTSSFTEGWDVGSRYYWSLWERDIDNLSGGSITVYEIALVFRPYSAIYITVIRDVIAGGQVVTNGAQLTVQYEFRLTYP